MTKRPYIVVTSTMDELPQNPALHECGVYEKIKHTLEPIRWDISERILNFEKLRLAHEAELSRLKKTMLGLLQYAATTANCISPQLEDLRAKDGSTFVKTTECSAVAKNGERAYLCDAQHPDPTVNDHGCGWVKGLPLVVSFHQHRSKGNRTIHGSTRRHKSYAVLCSVCHREVSETLYVRGDFED